MLLVLLNPSASLGPPVKALWCSLVAGNQNSRTWTNTSEPGLLGLAAGPGPLLDALEITVLCQGPCFSPRCT